MDFNELGLPDALVTALQKEKITTPMPVQSVALSQLIGGANAYVSAETGGGKTLAYLLPIFCQTDPAVAQVQAMVLAPTHELASQIHQQALLLAQNSGLPVKSLLLIGGANPKRQMDRLKKNPSLVVGSTGRMLELIRSKKLKVAQVKTLVVDEADRMIVGDRCEEIAMLIQVLPKDRQLVFVSATESSEALSAAKKFSPDLVHLSAGANQINLDIHHLYFVSPARKKADLLRRLIRSENPERAIVFVHKQADAELVASKMRHYNIKVADLHGTREKLERKKAMDDIRSGKVQVLIASDVAARGIDIKGVTHVFNYDAPTLSKDYLHRAGRTGRAGQTGYAISFFTEDDERLARRYKKDLDIEMQRSVMREGKIIAADDRDDGDAASERESSPR